MNEYIESDILSGDELLIGNIYKTREFQTGFDNNLNNGYLGKLLEKTIDEENISLKFEFNSFLGNKNTKLFIDKTKEREERVRREQEEERVRREQEERVRELASDRSSVFGSLKRTYRRFRDYGTFVPSPYRRHKRVSNMSERIDNYIRWFRRQNAGTKRYKKKTRSKKNVLRKMQLRDNKQK